MDSILESRVAPQVEIVPWRILWESCQDLMARHCQEFGIESLQGYIDPEQRKILEQIDTWGNLVIALAWDPGPVGYICWVIERHQGLGAPAAKMGPWYVEPEYRGRGLAMKLYLQSLRSIKYRGCRWVLTTLPIRDKARRSSSPWGVPFETTYLKNLFPAGAS